MFSRKVERRFEDLKDKVHLRIGPGLFTVGIEDGSLVLYDHEKELVSDTSVLAEMGISSDEFGKMLGEIWGDNDRNPNEIYEVVTFVKNDSRESRQSVPARPVSWH